MDESSLAHVFELGPSFQEYSQNPNLTSNLKYKNITTEAKSTGGLLSFVTRSLFGGGEEPVGLELK
jgi:hypothetical protein